MSEFKLLCLVLGSTYWLLCALVVFRVSKPVGVHGNGLPIRRDAADWFVVITAPFFVTVFVVITAAQWIKETVRSKL